MPTVILPLASLDLDGDFVVTIDLSPFATKIFEIEGNVISEKSANKVAATVVIQRPLWQFRLERMARRIKHSVFPATA